jgi:2-dehydro-3-deoxy-D-arabinonate dehydratase
VRSGRVSSRLGKVEGPFDISMQITRGQADVFSAKTSTATMHRDLADLVDWTTRAMEFPQGLVLLTGTGLVPERDVTLQAGDVITIGIDCVGTLTNSVRMLGR